MLVTLNEILAIATEKNCAIGAFNTPNLECLNAVLDAAEKELRKRAFPALTEKLTLRRFVQSEDTMLSGMAQVLCDRIFDLSFPWNIVE